MAEYLVTGAAGFIGFHTSQRLLDAGHRVIGVDNLNDYYDPPLKEARLNLLKQREPFAFEHVEIADRTAVDRLFGLRRFDRIIHLAAQAGVRYSLENPRAYAESNLTGFLNILEGCRAQQSPHLLYASSSSVYGANPRAPFSESHHVDHPVSLYAATKKANELMAHTYSHLYGLPTTGLRFFTVYGPWGRPDMALFKFTRAILSGEPIDVYNHGRMQRDFTYVDDIVEGIIRLADHLPQTNSSEQALDDPGRSTAPYRVFNIGNNRPVELLRMIEVLEEALRRKATKNLLPMQPGDVPSTCADISALDEAIGFAPSTSIEEGIRFFVEWYCDFYGIND